MYLQYDCATTMVLLKATADLPLVNRNYVMQCSVITILIRFALNQDYSTNTLCLLLQCQYIVHWRINLSNMLLIIRISKPQVGLSIRIANYMGTWIQTCRNGGYCYFVFLSVVITNSITGSEYQHNYPALKLYSISCSSALVLVHIIKIRMYVVKIVNKDYMVLTLKHLSRDSLQVLAACLPSTLRIQYCYTCKISCKYI